MLRPWVESPSVPAALPFALQPDDEFETPVLPREHPRWVRDALAVSSRARRLFANLRPAAISVLGFWDHQTRAVLIGRRTLGVDSSGSYYAVQ
jgi:hypothetical protein